MKKRRAQRLGGFGISLDFSRSNAGPPLLMIDSAHLLWCDTVSPRREPIFGRGPVDVLGIIDQHEPFLDVYLGLSRICEARLSDAEYDLLRRTAPGRGLLGRLVGRERDGQVVLQALELYAPQGGGSRRGGKRT